MKRPFSQQARSFNFIRDILTDKTTRDNILRALILDEDLNRDILNCTQKMGGSSEDAITLFDDVLIGLVKDIQKLISEDSKIMNSISFKSKTENEQLKLIHKIENSIFGAGEKTVPSYIVKKVKTRWCQKLRVEPTLRQQVMQYVATDNTDLKKRILIKIQTLGSTADEAHDFYHQGFVQLEKKLNGDSGANENNYQGGDIKGFFYTICTNLKLNERRKKKPDLPGDPLVLDKPDNSTESHIIRNEQKALLQKWLDKLSEKCKQTLQMWNDGFSMTEIAEAIGYDNEKKAALARFRCLKKLMDDINYQLWKKTETE